MNRYIVLIYGDEQVWEAWTEQQAVANGSAHRSFNAEHGAAVVGGHELERTWKGRSVRAGDDGRPQVTDGSFLGGSVAVGGYYLIEAQDLDAAVRIAGDLPEASAPTSGVEVRPVVAH